ncbi:protein of unknown function [Pararobbsia alpina]
MKAGGWWLVGLVGLVAGVVVGSATERGWRSVTVSEAGQPIAIPVTLSAMLITPTTVNPWPTFLIAMH